MLQSGAFELRIALALVLIEHQPATLSLQGESPSLPLSHRLSRENSGLTQTGQADWLSSLREIVRARNDEAKQQSLCFQQAGKNGVDAGYEARIGPDQSAGGLYGFYHQPRAPGTPASATQAEGARTASGFLEVPERTGASEALPLSTRLRLAASTLGPGVIAALEPLLAPLLPALLSSSAHPPPPMSLPAVTRLLTAIKQSFEPLVTPAGVAGDSIKNGVATRFEALGTVAAWLIEQLEVAVSSEEGNRAQQRLEGQETGDGQTAGECAQRLALLLANLAAIASRDPTSLRTLITLLTTQLSPVSSSPSSSSPSRTFLAAEVILPSLVRQLVTLLRELVLLDAADGEQDTLRPPDTNTITDSDQDQWPRKTETISILLSLSHLVLDSVSTRDEKLDETMRNVAARVRGDLVGLLGTQGVDVQLAEVPLPLTATTTAVGEAAGISIESGVVGLIERLWELQDDDGAVVAAPATRSGDSGVA
ncbi:hypothetical protein JCM8115_000799 [Rhodotorula mucilaginosa]